MMGRAFWDSTSDPQTGPPGLVRAASGGTGGALSVLYGVKNGTYRVADSLCRGVWLGRKTATWQRQSPKVHSEATETSRRA